MAAAYNNEKLNDVHSKLLREIKVLQDQVKDLSQRVESNSAVVNNIEKITLEKI